MAGRKARKVEDDHMARYEFEQSGLYGTGNNPMIPSYRAELGTDKDGKKWLCEVSPTDQLTHMVWNVDFDTSDEGWVKRDPEWWTDDDEPEHHSSPFLRPEVIYARDFSKAVKTRYHRQTVEYNKIAKVIDAFVESSGIK